MIGFIKSFDPLGKIISKKYKVEAFLLLAAFILAFASIILFVINSQEMQKNLISIEENNSIKNIEKKLMPIPRIFVDISGAVEKPGVYEVTTGARLKDALIIANGLSEDADKGFFNRNFNLARFLTDQEKIYIPSILDINTGIVIEKQRSLDYVSSAVNPVIDETSGQQTASIISEQPIKININTDTIELLDQLPGVGKITAEKIIKNRPYAIVEDLLTKKVVNKSVYEQVKNLIQL